MDDDRTNIAPFWNLFSSKLQSLYDASISDSYKPLLLDEEWWSMHGNEYCSKYNVSSQEILNELRLLTMKFKNIQEILYQSNPSLNVIVTYYETAELMSVKSILSTKGESDFKGFDSDASLRGDESVDESKCNMW
eukprot:TRINITY_DN1765_c0_g1_i1.p1 TRINITY_DN1765_c0_g1~~TRINITY_DN1765_c0_g1_i1.p1  ORF type:complete len:135 (+),score=38.26 TRINITY_DN1765_c0_g1_i1:140-544(+)